MELTTTSALPRPKAEPLAHKSAHPEVGHPFRWTQPDRHELPVTVTGKLPGWLKGQLMRTAPAGFVRGTSAVQHWFDAHGLIYAFDLGEQPRFRQRLLASRAL